MFTNVLGGSALALGLVMASTMLVSDKKETQDCCARNLACCKEKSACCKAPARRACCEKGMKCCEEVRACCTAPQKCCDEGKACCDEAKACCGPKQDAANAAGSAKAQDCEGGKCSVAGAPEGKAAESGKTCCTLKDKDA